MRIALVENFGSDFYNARLRYAKYLIDKGHEVVAVIPNDGYAEKIQEAGVDVLVVNGDVRKRSISNFYFYFKKLFLIFRSHKFDVVHFYRMQPNLIGTIAAGLSGHKLIFNHITGFGVAFSNKGLKYKIIRFFILLFYRINYHFFKVRIILQNEEDKKELNIESNKIKVVKGSAVDESRFYPMSSEDIVIENLDKLNIEKNSIKLLFVSRLLKQKGLGELVEVVNKINTNSIKVELFIVGWIDNSNPDSFTKEEIEGFRNVNGVHVLGKREDINKLISLSDICILPTYYREGTPRFLLESMVMGKPIITTDMPGCNHLVNNNENGILVVPKSVESLYDAIMRLMQSNLMSMGYKSRELYLNKFSESVVYSSIHEFYTS